MNALALLAEADPGGRVQQIASTFGVDWPHLVAQIISFGIVCILLQRFAYKPVLRMLEERRRQIAQGVTDTENLKAEMARAETRRHEILREAEAEATHWEDAHLHFEILFHLAVVAEFVTVRDALDSALFVSRLPLLHTLELAALGNVGRVVEK